MEIVYSTCTEQEIALNAIIGERAYQDAKWGTVQERPKQVGSYMTLMRKLLRDAEDAWATNDNDESALAELRKVVAVGVACFEQHGVPVRDIDSAVVDPERMAWPPKKDERLAGVSNERLHKGYDALRGKDLSINFDFDVDGKTLTLTRDEIDTELEARGDCPIPF